MTTQLDMAEQQLYGWHCAKAGEQFQAAVIADDIVQPLISYIRILNEKIDKMAKII